MKAKTPLRVCLDVRRADARLGGAAKVIIELASSFSKMPQGDEEYLFLVYPDMDDWLRPYVHGPCRFITHPHPPPKKLKKAFSSLKHVRALCHWATSPFARKMFRASQSDGTIERAGVDIVHFTHQAAFLTAVPSIYQPHDLQHVHLPHFFTRRERLVRTLQFNAFCHQASLVVAMSQWGKADLLAHLHLPDDQVQIVPWGPLTDSRSPSSEDLSAAEQRLRLPSSFLFFPAQTWPHKNHIALMEALATIAREYKVRIPLVCSGSRNEFFPEIERSARKLKIFDQIQFVGFVSELEMRCLYHLARGLVFPTRFEGWGLPITEAFSAGLPVACSNVTCLPALVADAALVFDVDDPGQMIACILRLWNDETLRRQLIEKGKKRAALFSWDFTARLFRAHYRHIACRPLTEEDHQLLSQKPLV